MSLLGDTLGSPPHQSQHLSPVDEFRIVKVEVIVLRPEMAELIAARLMEECFANKPGIVSWVAGIPEVP